MNRYFGIAILASALAAQVQLRACAQSVELSQSQMSQLQPAMSPAADTSLRGPIGGQSEAQPSSPQPFTASSPYSYSAPAESTNSSSSAEVSPSFTAPSPVMSPSDVPSTLSKNAKPKKHGFSPFGVVFGMQDRAFKSSLGLTDRTAKASLGVTGKTTKEVFKAIF